MSILKCTLETYTPIVSISLCLLGRGTRGRKECWGTTRKRRLKINRLWTRRKAKVKDSCVPVNSEGLCTPFPHRYNGRGQRLWTGGGEGRTVGVTHGGIRQSHRCLFFSFSGRKLSLCMFFLRSFEGTWRRGWWDFSDG